MKMHALQPLDVASVSALATAAVPPHLPLHWSQVAANGMRHSNEMKWAVPRALLVLRPETIRSVAMQYHKQALLSILHPHRLAPRVLHRYGQLVKKYGVKLVECRT